jgi:hypothetical protein
MGCAAPAAATGTNEATSTEQQQPEKLVHHLKSGMKA